MDSIPIKNLEQQIIAALHTCYDPEIPVDIFELGLIYEINVDENRNAHIKMTLTSPMCPSAQVMPAEVENKVSMIQGINSVKVEVVWSPSWTTEMMSEAAKLQLGFL